MDTWLKTGSKQPGIDRLIVFVVAMFSLISIVSIASATRQNDIGPANYFYLRQIIWYAIGTCAAFLAFRIDYHDLLKKWHWLYIAGISMLVLVFLWGKVTHGANSWLKIGPFTFEPAEFMKIILIMTLAKWFAGAEPEIKRRTIQKHRDLLVPIGLALIPCLLVLLQPDMGTTLMMSAVAVGILYVNGIQMKHGLLLAAILAFIIAFLVLIYFYRQTLFFHIIHKYQWQRLISFLNPEAQKSDAGYQVYQSMLAIGGGQIFGLGLFKGIQSVPERHTDFIFSVFSAETGFIGAAFILLLYAVLLYRMIKLASYARDLEGTLLITGVISMFLAQIVENIGMTISVMPITGITLPLISYGGSSILTTMIAIGLVLNVGVRSKKGWFY
ncbi:MAG: rod shape-determining protein RodA [Bacilli bacterium]|nr:rod shape-determining protein RodA [Bacilli bacterium]